MTRRKHPVHVNYLKYDTKHIIAYLHYQARYLQPVGTLLDGCEGSAGDRLAVTWPGTGLPSIFSVDSDTIFLMKDMTPTLNALRRNPKGVRFLDLCRICDEYFGEPRQKGTSHRVYRTPWPGDPRVNIQDHRGMAKAYQVRQVVKAIEKLEAGNG